MSPVEGTNWIVKSCIVSPLEGTIIYLYFESFGNPCLISGYNQCMLVEISFKILKTRDLAPIYQAGRLKKFFKFLISRYQDVPDAFFSQSDCVPQKCHK